MCSNKLGRIEDVYKRQKLDIVLMQFVRLMQDGQPVRMSKRTGKAIGLAELLDLSLIHI